ncbi:hypothetical protein BDR26DRAFT_852620, partial [Obelidium mucronatum]
MSLFGGAISLSIPAAFVDASLFRQVPDHQEVFVSSQDKSQSLIVEILEMTTESDDAVLFHFNELAVDNDAQLPDNAIVQRLQLPLLPSMNLPYICNFFFHSLSSLHVFFNHPSI